MYQNYKNGHRNLKGPSGVPLGGCRDIVFVFKPEKEFLINYKAFRLAAVFNIKLAVDSVVNHIFDVKNANK